MKNTTKKPSAKKSVTQVKKTAKAETKMKVCTICGKRKPLSEFRIDYRYPDGHRNQCKECINKMNRERNAKKAEIKAGKKRVEEAKKQLNEACNEHKQQQMSKQDMEIIAVQDMINSVINDILSACGYVCSAIKVNVRKITK